MTPGWHHVTRVSGYRGGYNPFTKYYGHPSNIQGVFLLDVVVFCVAKTLGPQQP